MRFRETSADAAEGSIGGDGGWSDRSRRSKMATRQLAIKTGVVNR